MRIKSVEITNFRCLRHVDIDFDRVTTFVGPNGAGKSTILRALDWFFNGEKSSLSDDDVYHAADPTDREIKVKVVFGALTELDRRTLGEKYAPPGTEEFTAWRSWKSGSDKFTGKALAFAPFELVRTAEGVSAKREALNAARAEHPDLDLPAWSTIGGTNAEMDEWERGHPEHLSESVVSDTHFFGFHSQRKLSGIFDFVFVGADLRATEEAADHKGAIIGRILEKTIDRSAADEALENLARQVSDSIHKIHNAHLADQLSEVASSLTSEVQQFTSARFIKLDAQNPSIRPQSSKISVSVADEFVETSIDRQGHGFQRALIISSLKLLAERGSKNSDGVICLAIEEPELFQHPSQARLFASVLRELAQRPAADVQVLYATHSPYFIEPRYFDQVRRVSRVADDEGSVVSVRVDHATMDGVCARLKGFTTESAVRARWHQVCIQDLDEAFFADAVLLVEGDNDKGIFDGLAGRDKSFERDGIVVACAQGKEGIYVPHAILTELNIPIITAFDNDSGAAERRRRSDPGDAATEADAAQIDRTNMRINRTMCKYFDHNEEDYPVGKLSGRAFALDDRLETQLEKDWPEWQSTRNSLVTSGRGGKGKNAATYRLAAEECPVPPKGLLSEIVSAIRTASASVRGGSSQ